MKVYRLFLLFWGMCYLNNTFGYNVDKKVLKELNATLYTLQMPEDTISFIKADTNTIRPKPTLLFCQGSLPIPLVFFEDSNYYFASFNFDYRKLSAKYNVVVISMPHTPVILNYNRLNKSGFYVPDSAHPDMLDSAYLTDNYLKKYVERANKVIDYIHSQSWAEPQSFYVLGHSQGAAVSVGIARSNQRIKAIGYLSGDPDGRVAQKIKNIRRFVQQKKISPEEGQKELNELYGWWKKICGSTQVEGVSGDTPRTWRSFSHALREVLVDLKIPVFIAYGTEDISGSGCELLPVYFELNHKTNYRMYPVVGCGHNFEEFTTDGRSDFTKMHWQEVVDHFIEYIEES